MSVHEDGANSVRAPISWLFSSLFQPGPSIATTNIKIISLSIFRCTLIPCHGWLPVTLKSTRY